MDWTYKKKHSKLWYGCEKNSSVRNPPFVWFYKCVYLLYRFVCSTIYLPTLESNNLRVRCIVIMCCTTFLLPLSMYYTFRYCPRKKHTNCHIHRNEWTSCCRVRCPVFSNVQFYSQNILPITHFRWNFFAVAILFWDNICQILCFKQGWKHTYNLI